MRQYKRRLIASASLLWLSPLGLAAAHAAEDPVTIEQMRSALADRDRAMAEMQRRMDDLERKLTLLQGGPAAQPPPPAPPAQASAAGQTETGPGAKIGAQTAQSADRAELQDRSRALERSLVLTGGLLLPNGVFEIEPTAEYDYGRTSGLQITPTATGSVSLATQDIRNQSVAFGVSGRVGLPWTSQLDLVVPGVWQRTETNIGGVVRSRDATGLGDVQVTLSKQFLQDNGRRPGLIGSVSYKAPTASSDLINVTPGSTLGFPAVGLSLTAIKRHDPLVFIGGYSHVFNFEDRRNGVKLKPGDSDSFRLGGLLAVSPDVSLRVQFLVQHSSDFEQDGQKLPGLGFTAGIVTFGGAVSLSDTVVLDLELGAGITRDAPDFTAAVSVPIRF